jgi:hypothetical protein
VNHARQVNGFGRLLGDVGDRVFAVTYILPRHGRLLAIPDDPQRAPDRPDPRFVSVPNCSVSSLVPCVAGETLYHVFNSHTHPLYFHFFHTHVLLLGLMCAQTTVSLQDAIDTPCASLVRWTVTPPSLYLCSLSCSRNRLGFGTSIKYRPH